MAAVPGSCSGLTWVERKPTVQGKVRGMVRRWSALAPRVRDAGGGRGLLSCRWLLNLGLQLEVELCSKAG